MLKIWGRLSSINVRKVVLAAQWLEVPFERTDAGHEFGIVKTPGYLAQNPNGLVPLIEDGDFRLWESNVIVRYLCAQPCAGPALSRESGTTLRRGTLDGLAADHAEPGRAPRLHPVLPDPGRPARPGVDREIGRGHRAADGAAGRASGAPALHGRRRVHHGRRPHRLRSRSLAGAAARAAGAAAPGTLVSGHPGPSRGARRARLTPS